MLVIGHRGAAGLAPENSLESLRAGVEAGADILEFDVRLTSDGVPVLIHDSSLHRTHHSRVGVHTLTLAELQAQTAEQPIPTLEQVLDEFFGTLLLNIELKSKGSGLAVTKLLARKYCKRKADWENVLISSFKMIELRAVRKTSKYANIALLHDQNPFLFIAYERYLRFTAVGFHRLYINKISLMVAKKLGLFTYAYTVNRPHTALLLDRQGIDGVVTNYPDKILSEIEQHSDSSAH